MKRFIIERNIAGASTLSAAELRDISVKSNEVVADLGKPYRWVNSYVAGDKIYCVHEAESAEVIREHARTGGFPADSIAEVTSEICPATATATKV
jgi:Nickel responsive protein SCO4226-like